MKAITLTLSIFLNCWLMPVQSQVKWDGAMDGDGDGFSWNDPQNWNLDRLPTPDDDVILDQTLHPFSYEVVLPSGDVTVSVGHLFIQPRSGSSILLTLPISNTGNPGFIATGSGDAVVLDSGAVFLNISGASSGTPVMVGTNNSFRINNGGRYIHRTPRGHTNNFVTRLSQVPGTEKGIFEFDVPGSPGTSYVVSGSGRTFGSLWLTGFAAGGNKTYVTSGANRLSVKGDLILQRGADYTHNIQNILGVEGMLRIDTGSLLNLSSGNFSTELLLGSDLQVDGQLTETGTGRPGLVFKGFKLQRVRIGETGSLQGDSLWMKVDNPLGIALDKKLTIPYMLIFSNGNLVSSFSAPLVFPSATNWTGASPQSHTNGPVQRIGNTDFTFPIGEGGLYAPIGIKGNPEAKAEEIWQAAYYRLDPRQMAGGSVQPTLSHVSQVEYWDIRPIGDSSQRYFDLYVGETSFANDSTALRVAFRGAEERWADLGNGGFNTYSLNPLTGMLRADRPIDAGGLLTLGSSEGSPVNPLPLHFVDCRLMSQDPGYKLTWTTGDIPKPSSWFTIERSFNNAAFEIIGRLEAGAKRVYAWLDSLVIKDDHLSSEWEIDPLVTYRIRHCTPDGQSELSPVMVSRLKQDWQPRARLYPNPLLERGTLELEAKANTRVEVQVYDRCGKLRKRISLDLKKGKNNCSIRMEQLEKGWYCIRIQSPFDQYPAIPFINR